MEQRLKIKQTAMHLRRRGKSIVAIEKTLGINRSTLSYWFKSIHLSSQQKMRLEKIKFAALARARIKAVEAHRRMKKERDNQAMMEAEHALRGINVNNNATKELCLAMLYLGEGFKKNKEFGLGNSNPHIVKLFLTLAMDVYGIPREKFYGELHLRADQNPAEMIQYWSKELKIPQVRFRVHIDKRTIGKKTYPEYHGVCSLRNGPVHFQRRVMSFGDMLIEKILKGDMRD